MNWKQPKVYAVKHKDAATIAASRSGGVFTALSDWVLSKAGILHATVCRVLRYGKNIYIGRKRKISPRL